MKEPQCIFCKFYNDLHCRRYPPQVYADVYEGSRGYGSEPEITTYAGTTWPRVAETDYCGEFKEKEK